MTMKIVFNHHFNFSRDHSHRTELTTEPIRISKKFGHNRSRNRAMP